MPTTSSDYVLVDSDRFYCEGGLRAMASPHVHDDDPLCPQPECGHRMDWIDFQLEPHGDPEAVDTPPVRAWWQGDGFAGRCPGCKGWIRFTTFGMDRLDDTGDLLRLPEAWYDVAQLA